MQTKDLDQVSRLFEAAVDTTNVDQQFWKLRFKEHVAQAIKRFGGSLKSRHTSTEANKLEGLRARLQLHEVIGDCLESRVSRFDPALADALHMWREANDRLISGAFDIAFSLAAVDVKNGCGATLRAAPTPTKALLAKTPRSPSSPSPAQFDCWVSPELYDTPATATIALAAKKAHAQTIPHVPATPVLGAAGALNPPSGTSKASKELSLDQVRDVMTKLYASKSQHNQRNRDMGEPLETIETHLYAFLGKRLGLPSAVKDWSSALFRAIHKFAPKAVDVQVFGKILQNQLPESFLQVKDAVKDHVKRLLLRSLEARHQNRPDSEVAALLRVRQNRGLPLSDCIDVLQQMYTERDVGLIRECLEDGMRQGAANNAAAEAVRYQHFLSILVSYQVQLTERFLVDFLEKFRDADSDGDGILRVAQFVALVERLRTVSRSESADEVDPKTAGELNQIADNITRSVHGNVTFSEGADLCMDLVSLRWQAIGEEPGLESGWWERSSTRVDA